jgi:Flp pilus assembly protein TadG
MFKSGQTKIYRRLRYQLGGLTVEFMFCVMILLVFMMAIIQYGVIMLNVNALNHVARETARYAEVHGLETTSDDQATDSISIRGELQSLCAHSPLNYSYVENTTGTSPALVTPTTYENRASGQLVTITIKYNMKPVIFLNAFLPGLSTWNTMTVQSTTVVDVAGSTQ